MRRFAFLSLIMFLVPVEPARAYLDPGSGSIMVQLLLGGAAGLFVIVKLCWRRITAFLGVRDRTDSRK